MLTEKEGEWYGGTPDSLWGYTLLLSVLNCIGVFGLWVGRGLSLESRPNGPQRKSKSRSTKRLRQARMGGFSEGKAVTFLGPGASYLSEAWISTARMASAAELVMPPV